MMVDAEQPKKQETYPFDYAGAMTERRIARRTAESQAAFFLPYLRTGMNLLDCGCGPGTITVGLAQAVSPGHVTGIDFEESQLKRARENAAQLSLTNVTFEQGSVYRLPYDDNQFDVVFCHAVLEHIHDPLAVVKEMYRVLKPGGLVGIRSPDMGATLYAPSDEVMDRAYEIMVKYRQHIGASLFVARRFRALLQEAGFVRTIGSSLSEDWGTHEQTQAIVPVVLEAWASPKIAQTAIQMGWADQAQMDRAVKSITDWGNRPDAFFSLLWCEAVGWKE